MLWNLRQFNPATDESFVFNSWLKSFKDAPMVSGATSTIYFKEMHDVIKCVIRDPSTTVIIASSPEDSESIFGYIVSQRIGAAQVIHWVYVKHSFRNFGIGRHLEAAAKSIAPHESLAYTLRTKLSDVLTRKDSYVYNPFILWKK